VGSDGLFAYFKRIICVHTPVNKTNMQFNTSITLLFLVILNISFVEETTSYSIYLRIELHVCCVYWCMNATGSFKVVWSPNDSSLTLKRINCVHTPVNATNMQFNSYIYTSFSCYTEHLICGRNYFTFDLLILKKLLYAFMNVLTNEITSHRPVNGRSQNLG